MPRPLVHYLSARADAGTFLLPGEIGRALEDLFGRSARLLPEPYRIFPADETQPPVFGFPVADSGALRDLETKLDRWLTDDVLWQVRRGASEKEKAQLAFNAYLGQLIRLAENAMLANLLNDYHGVFWLAHSFDVARHFASIPRRVSAIDTAAGRAQGDVLKYRIFSRWTTETREQMTQMAAKAAAILDGEEQRALQFFRLLQDNVLIFTEEFVGPDLRELRSFLHGYLHRDFQAFRDSFEKMRVLAADLVQKDRTFRAALPLFGVAPEQGVTPALLCDPRFHPFFFDHPAAVNAFTREDREQFQLIARRLREFAVLNQLRRGITWMTVTPDGQVVATDRRTGGDFSRSTRPMDFGRPGVLDPLVHRFGLIYDISAFSETLGNIRKGGRKEEIGSYRQMLLFQRRMETIAQRYRLQFEKFLGDGAFYTTRRALRLVRGAIEIQRAYSEMKRRGFAFNKGLRIALNYGYYRLLPMKVSPDDGDRITEFYGPGIVELSRLTTGKATKEIEDLAAFLVSHGYDQNEVQRFFAPLARGVDVIDHAQHSREFYAYVNSSGHLINEGIVASMEMLQELSSELLAEGQTLHRLRAPWGTYVGFSPAIEGVEYLGVRLLGTISLKGLDNIEVGEITPFRPAEVEGVPLDPAEPLVVLLRQEFHAFDKSVAGIVDADTTTERLIESEIVICMPPEDDPFSEVVIGEWNPRTDEVLRPLKMPRGDFQRLFSLRGGVTAELLRAKKEEVRELYYRLCERSPMPPVALDGFRGSEYTTFVLGEMVERL